MPFINGQVIDEDDFINEAEKDGTPANDEDKAVKLEADAKISRAFLHYSQKSTLVAGENITGATTPQACFIMSEQRINRYSIITEKESSAESDFELYKSGSEDRRAGFNFNSGSFDRLTGFAFYAGVEGSLAGHDYIMELFAVDGSGFPTGAAIASKTFTNAQYENPADGSPHWYVEFTSPVTISTSTDYIIVLRETTTTGSSSVNIHIYVRTTGGGMKHATTGTNWANGYPSQSGGSFACCYLYGYVNKTIGAVYLSDGNDGDKNYFDGFVAETDTAGNNVDLFYGASIEGFSGLLPGTDYFLDTTPGAITATKARGKKIGTAKSATAISINDKLSISSNYSASSDLATAIAVADGLIQTTSLASDSILVAMSIKKHEVTFRVASVFFKVNYELTNQNITASYYIYQRCWVSLHDGDSYSFGNRFNSDGRLAYHL